MTEAQWDAKLHIQTCGRDAARADAYRYPYEPTPYSVLERLADSGFLDENNLLIDYGCGKGRVGFFLNYKLGCQCCGIEYTERIYAQSMENLNTSGGERVSFHCTHAEDFEVEEADAFYFFNPFSVEILQAVLGKIMDSCYEDPREMRLFSYFPSNEYVAYLMNHDSLLFVNEIDCSDLFEGNRERERILIFDVI